MNIISELKRRNVIRMAGLYLVGAWLLTQVAGTVLPMFGAPGWIARSIVVLLALGFIPAMAFAWIFELTPDGLKRDAEVTPNESIAPQTARRMERLIIAMFALALIFFGFDKFVLAPKREATLVSNAVQASKNAKPAISNNSIAVMPFVNMSSDKEQEYFSDGMTEEILNALANVPNLAVTARTSVFSLKGQNKDVRDIGKLLGVAYVLEGSVRKAGDEVRITAQLIRTDNGFHLWSETYDRKLENVFDLQAELAGAIAKARQWLSRRILGSAERSSKVWWSWRSTGPLRSSMRPVAFPGGSRHRLPKFWRPYMPTARTKCHDRCNRTASVDYRGRAIDRAQSRGSVDRCWISRVRRCGTIGQSAGNDQARYL